MEEAVTSYLPDDITTATRLGSQTKPAKHLPGDELIWLFLMGDMATFSLFFILFMHYRVQDLLVFQAGQATLNTTIGAVNTLLLLASSWFVVTAVKAAREGYNRYCQRAFMAAAVLGAAFLVLKAIEFREKLGTGVSYLDNDFYLFYYLLTGIHFVHVLMGVPLLIYYAIVTKNVQGDDRQINALESGASYWHMVDLLWILIFPLLYLMP